MKYFYFLIVSVFLISIISCKNLQYPQAKTPIEAAREFIDGCIKGDFKRANAYMMEDSVNTKLMRKLQEDYYEKSKEDRSAYKSSSLLIESIDAVTDSIVIINYKNSYDKIARKVKVIQGKSGYWLVDFKYTFDGNL